jgi:small GTP-binding protein
MKQVKKKVILAGSMSVGKTSLVNKYIYHKFSEQYISTIGVRIDKKSIELGDTQLNMILWDLAGENNQINTPQSYFLGAGGVLYVIDLNNPATFIAVAEEIDFIKNKLPNVPLLLIGNKKDLLSPSELDKVLDMISITPDYLTSAKEGENVELIFEKIGIKMIGL